MPKIVRESSVTQARREVASFRTTIPKEIVNQLKLEHKDKVVWEVKPEEEEVKAVVYRKGE